MMPQSPSIEPLHPAAQNLTAPPGGLASYPPVERWEDWAEYDPQAWPRRVERRYQLVPTIWFNCEAGCGLLAYVDKDRLTIQKFEGNPEHPGSRGRNCAKGPATLNQVEDPERIRHPLKRVGPRGGGQWERVTWGQALDDIAARIRKALVEGRRNEVMYHVGRPGHELVYHQRIMHAWRIDGHNSHTNVRLPRARATRSGAASTARRRTTPTPDSSCSSSTRTSASTAGPANRSAR
jgi:anaerobic selenocysteine-containing dehydrogenase